MTTPPPLGLLAGMGELPLVVALEAKARGRKVVAVALEPLADVPLESAADVIARVNVGKLGEIIKTLKRHGVREAVMAGKVPKTLLYERRGVRPDLRAMKLLFTLRDRSDDTVMLAITGELEKDGIRLLHTMEFAEALITGEGVHTDDHPTKEEWEDVRFGWKIAKELGRLDIGQTVVVRDRAVMALEAIEGTDAAIRRGGKLAGPGATVVKVSKPEQDMRFDVPVVGIDTLRSMVEVKARVLAVEAGRSIFLHRERFIEEAGKAGIAVVGIAG